MKIAVLGAGVSGLGSAYLLSRKHEVDLYEKEGRLGGHARTTMVEENGNSFGVDTGFLVFNHETYPLLTKLFEKLDVKIENSEIENSIVMEGANIACGKRIIDSIIGMKANVVCAKDNMPSGAKLILGDMTYVGI